MVHPKQLLTLLLGWTLAVSAAAAQQPALSVGSPPGWNAAMTRLFGDIQAFSARAELRVLDRSGKESLVVPLAFALSDRKVRMDIEMTQMKGPQVQADQVNGMKQMGMDRLACVILPQKNTMQIVFPTLAAYVEMPLPDEEAAALNTKFKIDKKLLGNETVEGHPCARNRVLMTDDRGQKVEFIVWNASDLKDFPLQAQMNDSGSNVIIRYRNVQLDKPDPRQFETPASYKKHKDFLELMQAAAARQNEAAPKKK